MERDEYTRKLCAFPADYDNVIDLIMEKNKYANKLNIKEREEFAINAVHSCVREVVFGSTNYCSTGGCIAVRESNNPELVGYKKVLLGYRP